jgi:hypothetical protein
VVLLSPVQLSAKWWPVVEHQTEKSGGVKWQSEDQLREFISVEILDRRSPARTAA